MPKIKELVEARVELEFMEPSDDVILKRVGMVPVTNVQRLIARHSPDGFEWGYGGSGPSDLALNILLAYTNISTANRYYQDFKRDFLVNMPRSGGVIKREDVLNWLKQRKKSSA